MNTNLLADFARYSALIEQSLAVSPFSPEEESATALQVERGTIFPALLKGAPPDDRLERLIDLARNQSFARIAIVDRTGHHRPVYRALLVYSFVQSFRLTYESLPRSEFGRWEEACRAWCDLMEAELGEMRWDETATYAARGSSLTEAVWTALTLFVAGKVFVRDAFLDLASDVFGHIARLQQPNGAFLFAAPSDNPETHWYHELVTLHAAASYAVQAEDRPLAAAVQRNTLFHLEQTQPDHATTQPWGLFAFIWDPQTHPLADELLHSAQTQSPAGLEGVSSILLADTLYCLRLFTAAKP
jgi:hypothetical protein